MAQTPSTPDLLKAIQELQSELGRLQLQCSDEDRAYWALGVAYEALHGAWWELQALALGYRGLRSPFMTIAIAL